MNFKLFSTSWWLSFSHGIFQPGSMGKMENNDRRVHRSQHTSFRAIYCHTHKRVKNVEKKSGGIDIHKRRIFEKGWLSICTQLSVVLLKFYFSHSTQLTCFDDSGLLDAKICTPIVQQDAIFPSERRRIGYYYFRVAVIAIGNIQRHRLCLAISLHTIRGWHNGTRYSVCFGRAVLFGCRRDGGNVI